MKNKQNKSAEELVKDFNFSDNTQNAYILFGWEGIECRPNLDPFDGTLRMYDETQQVWTTDVHIKHHARRGIQAAAELDFKVKNPEIYYEKQGSEEEGGKARSVDTRVAAIKKNYPKIKTGDDVYKTCLDIPLFGFVWAKKGENFSRNGAINTILRPTTFHAAETLSLGRNNAFANNGAEASGSATVTSLEYGYFLALFEVNIPTLKENTANHGVFKNKSVNDWLNLMVKGLWRAYTTHRYSSFTQRGQYAQFVLGWNPKDESNIDPVHPRNLIELLPNPNIRNSKEAKEGLKAVLPKLLEGWQYSKETEAGRIEKKGILTEVIS